MYHPPGTGSNPSTAGITIPITEWEAPLAFILTSPACLFLLTSQPSTKLHVHRRAPTCRRLLGMEPICWFWTCLEESSSSYLSPKTLAKHAGRVLPKLISLGKCCRQAFLLGWCAVLPPEAVQELEETSKGNAEGSRVKRPSCGGVSGRVPPKR